MGKLKGDYQLIRRYDCNAVNLDVVGGLTPIRQSEIYLSQEDQDHVDRIASRGPYVVLHPFAGGSSRMVMPIKEYYPLVTKITNRGLNVVVVGANWIKPDTFYPGHEIVEKFDQQNPRIVNLIDRANPRVVAGLVMESTALISVRSYCFALTKSGRVNSVLLVSHPNSRKRTYFTPCQTRVNLLGPLFGWSENTVDQKIKLVGVDDRSYQESRRVILAHLDQLLKDQRHAAKADKS